MRFRGKRDANDRQILRLALPALGALVAEPLFLLVDSAIIGHLGPAQLAGLGVAGAALSTLVNICIFLAYGTTGSVARLLGAGDLRGAIQQGVNGMWLALGVGLLSAAVCVPLAPEIARALGCPADALPYAVTYLRISAAGVPAMLLVLAGTGMLRGLHSVRTPLVVAVAGFTANAVLNYLLVYPAGLGIAGSALGTVASQLGMAAAYVLVTLRGIRRHGAQGRPHWAGIRAAGTASTSLLLRTLTLRVYLLVATWVAARSGTAGIAAHTVASNVWNFLALALDALAIAAQAIVARGLGAGDTAAVRAAVRRMVQWSVVVGVAGGVGVLVASPLIVPLFTDDREVRVLLAALLLQVALLQPLCGVVFLLDGVLIGAGDGNYLAIAGLGTTAVFLIAAAVVHQTGAGVVGLWWAVGLFMLARLATLAARARTPVWMVTGTGTFRR
jgi:putative MATE family efflux protein